MELTEQELTAQTVKFLQSNDVLGPDDKSHTPISLYPAPFPATLYKTASQLASLFNQLVYSIVQQATFLQDTVTKLANVDQFCEILLFILKESNYHARTKFLNITRSDYLYDPSQNNIYQVELNTIACSFIGQSSLVTCIQNRLFQDDECIISDSLEQVCFAFCEAIKIHGNPEAAIAIIIRSAEAQRNSDHRIIANCLKNRYQQKVIFIPIEHIGRISTKATINQLGERAENLYWEDSVEIGVVYWRAGYDLADYSTEAIINGRIIIERSNVFTCPDICSQLVGLKKIQQLLTNQQILQTFVNNEQAQLLASCFTNIYSFDEPNTLEKAIEAPDKFVLKPQREGGGNNIFGQEILEFIQTQPKSLSAYVLMERIKAYNHPCKLIRENKIYYDGQGISELGIVGIWLSYGEHVYINRNAGYLCRTKPTSVDEGGVFSGFACLSSIRLIR